MQGMNKVGNWAEDGYPEAGRYGVWRENEISGASHTYLASTMPPSRACHCTGMKVIF